MPPQGSVAAIDFTAGLQAAQQIFDESGKNRRQARELASRANEQLGNALLQVRQLGLDERALEVQEARGVREQEQFDRTMKALKDRESSLAKFRDRFASKVDERRELISGPEALPSGAPTSSFDPIDSGTLPVDPSKLSELDQDVERDALKETINDTLLEDPAFFSEALAFQEGINKTLAGELDLKLGEQEFEINSLRLVQEMQKAMGVGTGNAGTAALFRVIAGQRGMEAKKINEIASVIENASDESQALRFLTVSMSQIPGAQSDFDKMVTEFTQRNFVRGFPQQEESVVEGKETGGISETIADLAARGEVGTRVTPERDESGKQLENELDALIRVATNPSQFFVDPRGKDIAAQDLFKSVSEHIKRRPEDKAALKRILEDRLVGKLVQIHTDTPVQLNVIQSGRTEMFLKTLEAVDVKFEDLPRGLQRQLGFRDPETGGFTRSSLQKKSDK